MFIWVWLVALSLGAQKSPKPPQSELRAAPNTAAIKTLGKQIQSILPGPGKGLAHAVIVKSLENGDTLYEGGADDLLVPASVAKLFTTYTALKRLKPTSVFTTQILTNGTLKDGTLVGDLYIKGGGDPSLVSERLWMLVNELKRSGIQNINGNIIADDSYFDDERKPESRPQYLKDEAYNAPINGLSFNFNTTTVYVRPAEKVGEKPIVFVDPENSYIEVVNQATTGAADSHNDIAVTRTEFVKGDIGDTVLLRGKIPMGSKEMRFFRNIVNPSRYTAHMFKAFWEQRSLKCTGKVEEAVTPATAKVLLEFQSLPLWQIVWGMNKFSSNFVADQILKKVGAEVWGLPGTRKKGIAAIEDSLETIGIRKGSYQIEDGSGLTRSTKVTARQILRVLEALYTDFSVSPEALASLGIAGQDGTLKKRFPAAEEKVIRAKTGSLDGVNSLAGYAWTKDHEKVAFVILLNDPKQKFGRMIDWIDRITLAITEFSRG